MILTKLKVILKTYFIRIIPSTYLLNLLSKLLTLRLFLKGEFVFVTCLLVNKIQYST